MTSATPIRRRAGASGGAAKCTSASSTAAIGAVRAQGFAATTALEIADTADVAEKTFYNHFPTKQHLIEELAQRSLEGTAKLLDDARRHPGTTADRLRHFFERSADGASKARASSRAR